jgi:hypothetical protein
MEGINECMSCGYDEAPLIDGMCPECTAMFSGVRCLVCERTVYDTSNGTCLRCSSIWRESKQIINRAHFSMSDIKICDKYQKLIHNGDIKESVNRVFLYGLSDTSDDESTD